MWRSIIFVNVSVCSQTNALTITVVIHVGIMKWRCWWYPTSTALLLIVLQRLSWLLKSIQLIVVELFSIWRYRFLHRVSAYFTAWIPWSATWNNLLNPWVVVGGTNWSWLCDWIFHSSRVSSLMTRLFIVIKACTCLFCSNWHGWW